MADERMVVEDGMVVSIDYTLRLDDGRVVDSSAGEEPLDFLQGGGQIIPGLEQALYGLSVGDEKHVTVPPGEAYGELDPNAFQLAPRNAFPPELELSPGMQLQARDQQGQVFPVYVSEIRPDGVLINFNHPLAGQQLHFETKVVGLRQATAEEMSHGHSHGSGNEH